VLEGTGPLASYRAAYRLLAMRFSRIALTWALFLVVGIGVGIVLQLLLSIVWVPFAGPVLVAISSGRWGQALSAAAVALAVLVPISVVVSSAAGAYFATAWTVAYRRFGIEGEIPEPPPLPV
jgi:hypothetical protein